MDTINPIAQDTNEHRVPNTTERQNGFPAGPLDKQLWNFLMFAIQKEVGEVVAAAGLTPNDTVHTWLRDAILQLINNSALDTEAIQDVVGALITGQNGIITNYDDPGNQFIIEPGYATDQNFRDAVSNVVMSAERAAAMTLARQIRSVVAHSAQMQIMPQPKTAQFSVNGNGTGAIDIEFDLTTITASTFISFELHTVTYNTLIHQRYRIQAYLYQVSGEWFSANARADDAGDMLAVRFHWDTANEKAHIYIGELDTEWNYLRAWITNMSATEHQNYWDNPSAVAVQIANLEDTAFAGVENEIINASGVPGSSAIIASEYRAFKNVNPANPTFGNGALHPDAVAMQDGDLVTQAGIWSFNGSGDLLWWMAKFDAQVLVSRVSIYPVSNWDGPAIYAHQALTPWISDSGSNFVSVSTSDYSYFSSYQLGTTNPVIIDFVNPVPCTYMAIRKNSVSGNETNTPLAEIAFE